MRRAVRDYQWVAGQQREAISRIRPCLQPINLPEKRRAPPRSFDTPHPPPLIELLINLNAFG